MQATPPCAHFDPEGLFTTLGGASTSVFAGLYWGVLLLQGQQQSSAGAVSLAGAACAGGLGLHASGLVPLNKNLYSPSFVLLTAGLAGALLHLLHLALDRPGLLPPRMQQWVRACLQPLRWLGLNAIVCFFGDEFLSQALPCVFWKQRSRNLITWLFGGFVVALRSEQVAQVVFAAADGVFWTAVAGWLYHRGIFFKV